MLLQGVDTPTSPRTGPLIGRLEGPAPVLLIGNSVTQAGLDPRTLGATAGSVSGASPAHWIAVLQRARDLDRVVLYVSPQSMDDVVLDDPDDQEALLQLLSSADPELTGRALPDDNAALQLALRNRVSLRRQVVEGIANTPAEAILGLHKEGPIVGPATERLFAEEIGPNEAPRLLEDPVGREPAPEPWPTRASLDESLMPLLVQRSLDANARLVVVLPAGRGDFHCEDELAPTRAWWSEQPVDLVDFSTETLPADSLSRDWHATRQGRTLITERLARVLDTLPPVESDAPGRQWGSCF
ncbi:MAG TPA: hypothetical protein QGF58_18660 [Myxococcota bacterium]|nr:hypothetical protein [Myxococcota bacterium]